MCIVGIGVTEVVCIVGIYYIYIIQGYKLMFCVYWRDRCRLGFGWDRCSLGYQLSIGKPPLDRERHTRKMIKALLHELLPHTHTHTHTHTHIKKKLFFITHT